MIIPPIDDDLWRLISISIASCISDQRPINMAVSAICRASASHTRDDEAASAARLSRRIVEMLFIIGSLENDDENL
jgi:hypothetical protein